MWLNPGVLVPPVSIPNSLATFNASKSAPGAPPEIIFLGSISSSATSVGTLIPPKNRIYPITEAGIFNKHKKDLGIFDVGNRTYTGSDADITNIAHIDTRAGLSKPSSGTTIQLAAGTVADDTNHPEIEGVLTSGGANITASSHGFTQGPLTQTMLCRTTFDPVNKATADTLQITWSVQLQDAT